MKIAIHTKELENARVDGTMVYIANVLQGMQKVIDEDDVYLYHAKPYNTRMHITPHTQFHDRLVSQGFLWTQTRFTSALWHDQCDAVWMPLHNLPFLRRKTMRTIVTIHDLAFKIFPDTYPASDRRRLNLLTDHAVRYADAVIAISQSTKNDLLKFYPHLQEEKIHVIHHGFDPEIWKGCDGTQYPSEKKIKKYAVCHDQYIIHVGAIQPRKNLHVLIDAFAQVKISLPQYKLVLVGGDGWLARGIHEHIAHSPYRDDIVVTGNVDFADVRALVAHARVCVMPSLYEGFGLPGLEAMASGVPVVASTSSCFPEIFGNGARYFDAHDVTACAKSIITTCTDEIDRQHLLAHAKNNSTRFSWAETASQTIRVIRG
jgi:glycosyltransferase involved in cell wall biosynthesis